MFILNIKANLEHIFVQDLKRRPISYNFLQGGSSSLFENILYIT